MGHVMLGNCSIAQCTLLVFRVLAFIIHLLADLRLVLSLVAFVFIIRKLNRLLSTGVFNSKRDTLMCMLLN